MQATLRGHDHMHETRHLPDVTWRKSRRSGAQGNCVELAAVSPTGIGVRNSRFPDGDALVVPAAGLTALVAAVKAGDFDGFLSDTEA